MMKNIDRRLYAVSQVSKIQENFRRVTSKGFSVSFNKGSFIDPDGLEDLIDAIKSEVSNKEFDLLLQAEKYTKPKTKKHNEEVAKKLVKKH